MPRKAPVSFLAHVGAFKKSVIKQKKIMFCKRYKIHGGMEISPGAIVLLKGASKGLMKLCKNLYLQDSNWFMGDVEALLEYDTR